MLFLLLELAANDWIFVLQKLIKIAVKGIKTVNEKRIYLMRIKHNTSNYWSHGNPLYVYDKLYPV